MARAVRAAFPLATAMADEIVAVFPSARLCYAAEAGLEIGKPSPGGIKCVDLVVAAKRPKAEKEGGRR